MTGKGTGTLDYGCTLVIPARFDVAFALYFYSGAFIAGLGNVRDRQALVREAMTASYQSVLPGRAAALLLQPVHEALAIARIMNAFDHLDPSEGMETAVAGRVREPARELLATGAR